MLGGLAHSAQRSSIKKQAARHDRAGGGHMSTSSAEGSSLSAAFAVADQALAQHCLYAKSASSPRTHCVRSYQNSSKWYGVRLIRLHHPQLCPQLGQRLGQWMILEPQRRKDLAPCEAKSLIHMVGVRGLEPPTPCTPCNRFSVFCNP